MSAKRNISRNPFSGTTGAIGAKSQLAARVGFVLVFLLAVLAVGCGKELGTEPTYMNATISDRYGTCVDAAATEELTTVDVDRFEARLFQGSLLTMSYRLFIPESYSAEVSYPLILYLHGGSGNGTDNLRQVMSGANAVAAHTFSSVQVQQIHPCFILSPQIRAPVSDQMEGWWATITQADLSANLRTALEMLDAVATEFSIDRSRVYAVGNSLGGAGVWDLVSKAPGRFAAFIPLASPVQWAGIYAPSSTRPVFADLIAGKNFWYFYGADDGQGRMKPWWDEILALLRDQGEDPRYTEYLNGGHDVYWCVFTEPDLISWLFIQSIP